MRVFSRAFATMTVITLGAAALTNTPAPDALAVPSAYPNRSVATTTGGAENGNTAAPADAAAQLQDPGPTPQPSAPTGTPSPEDPNRTVDPPPGDNRETPAPVEDVPPPGEGDTSGGAGGNAAGGDSATETGDSASDERSETGAEGAAPQEIAPLSANEAQTRTAPSVTPFAAAAPNAQFSGDNATLLAKMNQARLAACVPELRADAGLAATANSWSRQMASKGALAQNPKVKSLLPKDSRAWGELVSQQLPTPQLVFETWNAKPQSKKILLNSKYTSVGIGMVRSGKQGPYATQLFAARPADSGGVFLDVRPWRKFYTEINWMGTSGLSTGVNTGCTMRSYQPMKTVTREAMAAFLYRLSGAKYKGPAVSPFADVAPNAPFYNEIAWMYHEGISTGVAQPGGRPRFQPKQSVSREAMAAFLYRFSGAKKSPPRQSAFVDVVPGQRFYREISWMASTGLSTGEKRPSGKAAYAPAKSVTREAMAAFIYRMDRMK